MCIRDRPRTVQTHRSNILRKLNLKGTPKLIAFAVEHGFTPVSYTHLDVYKRQAG